MSSNFLTLNETKITTNAFSKSHAELEIIKEQNNDIIERTYEQEIARLSDEMTAIEKAIRKILEEHGELVLTVVQLVSWRELNEAIIRGYT